MLHGIALGAGSGTSRQRAEEQAADAALVGLAESRRSHGGGGPA